MPAGGKVDGLKTTEKSPRGLAVVRCGENTLHRTWVSGRRNFDVGISYYGSNSTLEFPEADYVHHCKGGKWDGLFSFFKKFPGVLDRYDYFWLPDDDIVAVAADIDSLFALGIENEYHVYQPSLDEHSYYSHVITLQHPSFEVRYTNFVEVMVPFISREVLIRSLPFIEKTASGFGLDFLWPQMVREIKGDAYCGVAVVDTITVRHTRPVGGNLHQFMRDTQRHSARDEMGVTMEWVNDARGARINGVSVPRIRILSGTLRGGLQLKGLRLARQVWFDLLYRFTNKSQPVKWFAASKHAVKAGFLSQNVILPVAGILQSFTHI
ncbi:hypothetical protein JZX87_28160 [Agrobacterium sp. Ap1]|nr:hypothetical protein [Agrobacterium sp. Ap1]